MKEIFQEYGGVLITVVAILAVILVCCRSCRKGCKRTDRKSVFGYDHYIYFPG